MFQPIQRKVKKHLFTRSERENRAEWSTGVAEGSRLTDWSLVALRGKISSLNSGGFLSLGSREQSPVKVSRGQFFLKASPPSSI